jgi:hypothetical protein
MRNFRQALASPRPGGIFTIRSRPTNQESGIRGQESGMTKSRVVIALLSALLVSGCALRTTAIARVKDQPYRYYNRTVSVAGRVTNTWGLPLVPFQLYSVDDGTGQITVLSNRGPAPPRGAVVHVKGRVTSVANFGGTSLGLHIDEAGRRVRY